MTPARIAELRLLADCVTDEVEAGDALNEALDEVERLRARVADLESKTAVCAHPSNARMVRASGQSGCLMCNRWLPE